MGLRGPIPGPRFKVRNATPADDVPARPAWLNGEAARVWDELVPPLAAAGIIRAVDAFALGRYCRLWVRWKRTQAKIGANGDTYTAANGNKRVHPLARIAADLCGVLLALEKEFGMTPAARERLKLPSGPVRGDTKKMRFFSPDPGPA